MTDEFDLTMTAAYVTPGRRRNRWDATTAPTVSDDSGDGYEVGSVWADVTADRAYICLDPTVGAAVWRETSGAPDTVDYLVGTAQAGLSAEIVVGTTPGGELGGTWASPTVDATHSGSSHAATQAAAEATAAAALSGHAAAADPHTGYRLESDDHTHASSGAQGGQVAHSALTGVSADQHHARSHDHSNASDGTALAPASVKIGAQTDVTAPPVIIAAQTGTVEAVSLYRAETAALDPVLTFLKARGSFGAPSLVAASDPAGTIIWKAHDGAAFQSIARMGAVVDGTPGAGDTPGRYQLSTTRDGTSTPVTLWMWRQSGHIRPVTDSAYDVGENDAYVRRIYADMLHLGDPISPGIFTTDLNNFEPAGAFNAYCWRLSTDASRNLTGIVAGHNGAMHLLVNVGSFDLVLVHESASSTAANRFLCPGSANVTVNANDSVNIWYDTTSSRWRVVGL